MTSLYQISTDFQQMLDSAFDPETGEATEAFESMRTQLVAKASNVAAYIMNCELDAEKSGIAIKRISAYQKSLERKAEKLREYLAENMRASGITEIKADDRSFVAKLYIDRDESVEIDPDATFDAALCGEPKAPPPSKAKIKAAILAGEPVAGARIVKKDRLTIK